MKAILLSLFIAFTAVVSAQNVTAISPTSSTQGYSLYTTITASSLFITGSSPQGNIQNIILRNATDSVYAISDSTNIVSINSATTFWNIPANIGAGLYTLAVRVYNSLFSGPTTDYTLSNAFTINAAVSTVSGTVFNDLNHNGVMDAGEPGIPGYTITLSPVGNHAVSDASGNYTITTVPGLDTIVLQQPADDIYATSGVSQYILTVPVGATTGQNFGRKLVRYLTSMTPDSSYVGAQVTTSILSALVNLNESLVNVMLRHSTGTTYLIYSYTYNAIDSDHANATFDIPALAATGYYDLVMVVQSTINLNTRTFILDSAFKVGGPAGVISGYAFTDLNSNGVKDPGEPGIASQYIELSGTYNYSCLTDSSGYYNFHTLPAGNYTVYVYNTYGYYSGCGGGGVSYTTPTQYSVTSNNDSSLNHDFGSDSIHSGQYDIYIHPGWVSANPGFVRHYWIFYGNYASLPATGAVITMTYDSTLVFDSTDRTPATNNPVTHTMTWNVGSVPGGSWLGGYTGGFNLFFTVPVTDTAGRLLYSTFNINSTTGSDCTPGNNTVTDISPVTSSRDPNEKHANPYGTLIYQQDSIVTYTINFQNTGTASTHFVIVEDSLDPNLDPKTVIPTGSSAPFTYNINAGVLTVTFNPLILTDSATNTPQSFGTISFMAKLLPGLPIGTLIQNKANIYFDYNSAVPTNTTSNVIIGPLDSRTPQIDKLKVSVQPNPFAESTIVSFSNPNNSKYSLTVYDITGNVVRSMEGSDAQFLIEKGTLSSGVYLYKLTNQTTKISSQGKIAVL